MLDLFYPPTITIPKPDRVHIMGDGERYSDGRLMDKGPRFAKSRAKLSDLERRAKKAANMRKLRAKRREK